MQPEQFEAIATFCDGVTYNAATGELRGVRREFEPHLDYVLIARRRVEKGRIIAMLVYGYPHLLQPAGHLNIAEDSHERWAARNLRYTYEPEARNPLGLAEGSVYLVRGGTLHRLILPVGTVIDGNVIHSEGVDEDVLSGSFVIDGHGIIPTSTVGETPATTPVDTGSDSNLAPTQEPSEPSVGAEDESDFDDLM